MRIGAVALLLLAGVLPQAPDAWPPRFATVDLQRDWGVVYAVRLADVNADGRPDVVAINPSELAWFENPGWQRHVVLRDAVPRDHVTIAAADVDGDGRVEIALGAAWNPRNTTSGGTLHLARRSTPDGRAPWTVTPPNRVGADCRALQPRGDAAARTRDVAAGVGRPGRADVHAHAAWLRRRRLDRRDRGRHASHSPQLPRD
jgi:hypothetical protein